ncbi:SixA phosphatase family protein [Ferrimonas balearica]|uniref:SixA phosphatase family protein n=1 Tax=Ferrimonas balearica TaxID=44012 RepID=UPI001C99FB8D|nr:histidine phosphatase family protein [Ferrimonas balearica]MBY5991338.1 histidine phosphatase family protein [Ferrimonas balearica]
MRPGRASKVQKILGFFVPGGPFVKKEQTIKRLLIIRHAKSSWRLEGVADEFRPLAARGYRQAPLMAKQLPLSPQLWLCSPAIRAYSTAYLMMSELEPAPLKIEPALYPGDPRAVLALLSALPARLERVALVGHNPGLESLVQQISGEPVRLRTAEVVLLESAATHWADLMAGAVLTQLPRPE